MKLSPREKQILDEIQQAVRAQDPEFFASMVGSQSRRSGSVWGSVTFVSGLVTFMLGAVLAQASPGSGVTISLIGFVAMFWGVWLLCSGDRALPGQGQNGALQHRIVRLRDSTKDLPPPGV